MTAAAEPRQPARVATEFVWPPVVFTVKIIRVGTDVVNGVAPPARAILNLLVS